MKNKIEDVRNHLFATLEGLMDEEQPMDIERAQAVAQIAQVIINSAKIEVDFLKVVEKSGGTIQGTKFIENNNLKQLG